MELLKNVTAQASRLRLYVYILALSVIFSLGVGLAAVSLSLTREVPVNCDTVSTCLASTTTTTTDMPTTPPPPPAEGDVNGTALTCPDGPIQDLTCFPANLTLNSLTVTTLIVQNVTQSDISYQDVFEVDNLIMNGTMVCPANNTIDETCLPPFISTINVITPFVHDFTFIGGPGIAIAGGLHSLTISNNINVTVDGPFFVVRNIFGNLAITVKNQTANTVAAGPVSGLNGPPTFRYLVPSDLPLLNLSTSLFVGVLPQSRGGTGVSGQYLISGNGTTVVINPNGTLSVDFTAVVVTSVDLSVPSSIFAVTSSPIVSTGTLSFSLNSQAANTVWAGPLSGPNAAPSFRLLQLMDLPLIDLSTHVFDVLPVANGGTGSNIALTGGKIMMSSGVNTIVEGNLVGVAPGVSVTLTNATTFSISTSGLLNASLAVPLSIFTLVTPTITGPSSGALEFDLAVQSANRVFAGPAAGSPAQPTFRSIVQQDLPSIMTLAGLSVSGSTMLGTNTSCIAPILPSCYEISNQACPLGPLNQNCIPSTLHLSSLVVDSLTIVNGSVSSASYSNSSVLGDVVLNGTFTCDATGSISSGCLHLGNYTCPMGMPLAESCIPASLVMVDMSVTNNLHLNNVICNGPVFPDACLPMRIMTINGISPTGTPFYNFVINASTGIIISPIANGISIANTGVTSVDMAVPSAEFALAGGPVTTTGTFVITKQPQVAGSVWAGPVSGGSAQPAFRLLAFSDLPDLNLTGTGGVTVINGTIIAGNGATVSSVGLTLPASVFNVTVSPITTTGDLTAVFIAQPQKTIFGGPTSGANAVPTFRTLSLGDLPPLAAGSVYLGTGVGSDVVSGVVNGFGGITVATDVFGNINITGTGGTLTTVALVAPSAEFLVLGSPLTGTGGTLTIAKANQTRNTFWAGPESGADAQPSFRNITLADLAPLGMLDGQLVTGFTGGAPVVTNLINGSNIVITNTPGGIIISSSINASAIGTVYSVGLALPPSVFAVAGSPVSTIGTLTGSFVTQTANTFLAAPNGATGVPSFRHMVVGDLPILSNGYFIIGQDSNGPTISALTAGTGITITNTAGVTTIATSFSVGLSISGPLYTVTGSPVTAVGTLTATLNTQAANLVFAGPSSGGATTPTFRSLVPLDLPPLLNGQIYIGSAGVPTIAGISAGTGIMITTGPGTITVTALFTGTVTSVGLSLPSIFAVSGSPVTGSGTLTGTLATQSANRIFAGPTTGAAATPTFRAMVLADLPTLANGQVYIGNAGVATAATMTAGTGVAITNGAGTITIASTVTGTVTSVALALPSIFSVSGSPVTSTGTLTGTLAVQPANRVFAGPSSGGSAVPTFRTLVSADLPSATALTYSEVSSVTTVTGFSSASFTAIASMTDTLAAGTWHVSFSTTIVPSSSSATYEVQIFNGVTGIGHSSRALAGSSSTYMVSTHAVVVSNGSDAITIQWRKFSGSGSADMFARSMFALRVG